MYKECIGEERKEAGRRKETLEVILVGTEEKMERRKKAKPELNV